MLLKDLIILKEDIEFPEPVLNYINEHCQPYLDAIGHNMTGRLLYRGVSRSLIGRLPAIPELPNCSIVPGHYDNRKPRDTHIDVHNEMNRMFNEYHGAPFRNGLFVTGSLKEAKSYGEAVVIFPIGDFKFCWSPLIIDLIDHVPSNKNVNWDHDQVTEKIDRMIKLRYKTTDLPNAIVSDNEIMLYCDSCLVYVAV